jgi:Family of unknown function (DUF5767)
MEISMHLENPRQQLDVSSQPQMMRKEVSLTPSNHSYERPQQVPSPNLNVMNDSSAIGLDLILNPRKRHDSQSQSDVSGSGSYVSGSGSGSAASSSSDSGSGSGSDSGSYTSDSGSDDSRSEKSYRNDTYNRPVMSEEEIMNQKKELLYQFDRLERKGVRLPRKFTVASSLDEMKAELDKITRERQVDASIKFQRRVLVTLVTGIEMLNDRFDPVGARLKGWSESINENIDEYDEVFEELHDKYKGKAKMPPEVKLLMMLGSSAFMFHLTNTMFGSKNMPDMEKVFKTNPDLMKHFAAATANTMAQNDNSGVASMFSNMFKAQGFPGTQQAPQPSQPAQRPTMKGPSLDNLLSDFENQDRIETLSTLTESELSEIPDDASINGLLINKNKRGKRTMNI